MERLISFNKKLKMRVVLGQGNARARKCPPALYAIRCPEMPVPAFCKMGNCPLMPVPEKIARAARGHLWACHKVK